MNPPDDLVPVEVATSLGRWLDGFDRLAPGAIEGLYVVGSVALGDWTPRSDIDVVAVLADPADPETIAALGAAFADVAADLDPPIDGPFVGWGDLVTPPMALQRLWSLGGELHLDAECFELNPVTWRTLATHGITCRGDPAPALGVYTDPDDVRRFVAENVDTYWRAIAGQIRNAIDDDPSRSEFESEPFTWAVLGAARMLYSSETGEVISKSGAGRWAAARVPAFAGVLDLGVARRLDPRPVARDDVVAAVEFVERVVAVIAPS